MSYKYRLPLSPSLSICLSVCLSLSLSVCLSLSLSVSLSLSLSLPISLCLSIYIIYIYIYIYYIIYILRYLSHHSVVKCSTDWSIIIIFNTLYLPRFNQPTTQSSEEGAQSSFETRVTTLTISR